MTTTTTTTTSADRRTRVLTLSAASLALFVIFLDNTIVNVALPAIQRALSAAPDRLEWVVSAYVVAFAGLVLLGGKLGDRFGRRRMFVTGLLIFAAGSIGGAVAGSSLQLTGARAVQGVGAALLAPLSLSLLTHAFPREKLAAAIGVWAGVSGLGLAAGPLVGGVLVEHAGWQAVFWVNVPFAVVSAALAIVGVQESRDPDRAPIDAAGATLVTAGLVSTVAGLTRAVRHPWTEQVTVTLLVAGALLLAGFVVRQRRATVPLVPRGLAHAGGFRVAAGVIALTSFALLGSIWFLTLYLQNVAGYGALAAGVRTLPMTVTTLFVAPVAGKIAARRGPRPVMIAGLGLTGAAFVALARIDVTTGYGFVATALLALGTGLALVLPAATSAMLARVAPHQVGVASGIATMSRQLGGAFGLAVLATIGARSAISDLRERIPAPPQLEDLVAGGQTQIIGRIAGPAARDAAAAAFLHGFSTVMWICAATVAAAAVGTVAQGARTEAAANPDVEPAGTQATTRHPADAARR